jgi:hypothetical protein
LDPNLIDTALTSTAWALGGFSVVASCCSTTSAESLASNVTILEVAMHDEPADTDGRRVQPRYVISLDPHRAASTWARRLSGKAPIERG